MSSEPLTKLRPSGISARQRTGPVWCDNRCGYALRVSRMTCTSPLCGGFGSIGSVTERAADSSDATDEA